mgnify:CR=1 FL=1
MVEFAISGYMSKFVTFVTNDWRWSWSGDLRWLYEKWLFIGLVSLVVVGGFFKVVYGIFFIIVR